MSEKQSHIWFYTPTSDDDVPVIPNYNRMSTLLSQLVTTHIGLLYSWMTHAPLPYNPINVGILSTILLLILWSDTTPGDALSRADRAATRKFIANCLGLSYLVIFIAYSYETTAWMMGMSTLFSFLILNVVHGSELFEYQCLMCRLKEYSRREDSTVTDIEAPCVDSGSKAGLDVKVPAYEELKESSHPKPGFFVDQGV